jgi:hypothetical protein
VEHIGRSPDLIKRWSNLLHCEIKSVALHPLLSGLPLAPSFGERGRGGEGPKAHSLPERSTIEAIRITSYQVSAAQVPPTEPI